MSQKKNKSKPHEGKLLVLLANTKAPKKKRSLANRKKAKFSITNGDQNFNLSICHLKKKKKSDQICKGKSVSSNTSTQQQMDIDQDREATGIHIQEEILLEILSRLPVQSLQRFKCVSTFWEALISDWYFKMKHLNHAKNDQNSQKLLISQMCFGKDDVFKFYCSSLSSVQVVEDEQKLDCPSHCKPASSVIHCCCDGLVVLDVTDKLVEHHLLLWNPSTRESVLLPHPESPLKECLCGLGYDATSDDYKILAINLNVYVRQETSVEILSLKSGSWRKIDNYPTGVHQVLGFWGCGMDSLAFVNGAFHWLGLSRCYTIVSFGISNEQYGEIKLLERMCNMSIRKSEHGVSVLRGMLCFYSTYTNQENGTFKLWVMKDYGVEESWIELFTIQDTNLFYSARPKYMFVDGEVLLCCKHPSNFGSVYYSTTRGPFGLCPQCFIVKQGIVYTEGLISPRLLI